MLVLDRLAAIMVVLTCVIALAVVLYAIGSGWDRRGRHFHALLQFQLMGLFGAFLTGDLFNLFVFFEVLLIASYGLMIHGGGKRRLQAGVQYVVYNLLGSTLFLFALGTIYAVTGTLNMADLALRVGEIPLAAPHSSAWPQCSCCWFSRSRRRWFPCISGFPRPMPKRRGRLRRCSPS